MFDRFNLRVTKALCGIRDESGQTFVEYALVLAVIVVGVLLAATWAGLGTAINTAITRITTAIGSAS
jgi:Flp pilus assembly pilin Flp